MMKDKSTVQTELTLPQKDTFSLQLRIFSSVCASGRKKEKIFVRFEVFTEVTMKDAFFWYIKIQFVPHRRDITAQLHRPGG
jgi:hypothetical protein